MSVFADFCKKICTTTIVAFALMFGTGAAFATNNCTGATYYDAVSDTCIACPAGYDYDTTSGKTSASQCQITCPAGTTLSNEYTQLEYINFNNTYIYTGLQMVTNITRGRGRIYVDARMNPVNNNKEQIIVGGGNFWVGKDNNWCIGYGANNNDVCTSAAPSANRCIYDLNLPNNQYTVYDTVNDDYILSTSVTTGTRGNSGNQITIGGYSSGAPANADVYRVLIYNDGTLLRDFIPTRRNSDGELGMYDLVTNTFYPKASGSGTFTAGNDVGQFGGQCTDAGVGYWSAAQTINFGSVGTPRTACVNAPQNASYTATGTSASCPWACDNGFNEENGACICSGATYYDAVSDTCIACPAGYDYNTTSGKTSASQCQITCPAGTTLSNNDKYTQLEYIQTNGNEYIDTGIQSTGIGLETDVQLQLTDNSHGEQAIIGRSSPGGYEVYFSSSGDKIGTYRNSSERADVRVNYATNTLYRIQSKMTDTGITTDVNGIQQSFSGTLSTNITNTQILLFAHTFNYFLYAKVYYVKIWQNSALVRDFIPMRRNSDGELGMYDLVTNTFYPKTGGSGTFTAGNDVGQFGQCTDAGVGYWSAAQTVNYGSVGTPRTACVNAPQNASYTATGTSASCPWACDSGFTENNGLCEAIPTCSGTMYLGNCHQRCSAISGISELHVSNTTYPTFADKQGISSPVLCVSNGTDTCYIYFEQDTGNEHGLKVLWTDGNVYHAIDPQ